MWPGKWMKTPSNALAWHKMFHVRTLGNSAGQSPTGVPAGRGGGEVSIQLHWMDAAELPFGFKKSGPRITDEIIDR